MEAGLTERSDEKGEEEYVLLDLDAVMEHVSIRPDTPYVLTGLDTLNPMLIIDGKVKLIGEYEETIGTCLVFSENEAPVLHKETGPSDANLFSGRCIVDPNQVPSKEVKPVARLQKVLKFRLLLDEAPVLHKETGPSDANLFSGRCIVDPNQVPSKEVKPVARLQKVLKFRLLLDGVDDAQQDHPSTEGNASNQSTAAQN